MEAVLTKLKVKSGSYSSVEAGSTVRGEVYKSIRKKNGIAPKPTKLTKLVSLKVGQELLIYRNFLSFIKTSAVERIVRITKNTVTFETETSVYKLSLVKE